MVVYEEMALNVISRSQCLINLNNRNMDIHPLNYPSLWIQLNGSIKLDFI